jgi:hypothetical protein
VQGGIDTGVYSRHIQGKDRIRGRKDPGTGADLTGSATLLCELELLADNQLMATPIGIMLAFELDGHLLHLQFPVQLKLRDNNRRRSFYVSGLKGCTSLLHQTTITGCCRWLPAALNDTAPGYEPGLLVINLVTTLQSCDLGAATTPALTHQQVKPAGGEGGQSSQQARELQLSAEDMQGEEVGRKQSTKTGQEQERRLSEVQQELSARQRGQVMPASPALVHTRPSSVGQPLSSGPAAPTPATFEHQSETGARQQHQGRVSEQLVARAQLQPQELLGSGQHSSLQPPAPASLTTSQPASEQLLSAAAVVPYWDKKDQYLQLNLPQHVADACVGIQLEVGGVLLPKACTRQLSLRRLGAHGLIAVYQIIGLQHVKSLVHGAQLLPCRAVRLEAVQAEQEQVEKTTGQEGCLEQDRAHYQLVVCVQWPAAPVGQQV